MQNALDYNCRRSAAAARPAISACLLSGLPTILLSLWPAETLAAPRCTAGFLFCGNCVRPITVETKKNTTCEIPYFTGGAIFSQKVIKRGIGVYGTTNVTMGAYQPKAGYVGKDYFEVEIHYERSGSRFTTTLQANVTVTE